MCQSGECLEGNGPIGFRLLQLAHSLTADTQTPSEGRGTHTQSETNGLRPPTLWRSVMLQLDELIEPTVQFVQASEVQLGFQGNSIVGVRSGNGWVAKKSVRGNLLVSFGIGCSLGTLVGHPASAIFAALVFSRPNSPILTGIVTMLCVEKTTLGPFGEPELLVLLEAKGWRGALPKALSDEYLLQLATQLRDMLSGNDRNELQEHGCVALPIALLLVSKLGSDPEVLMADMTKLQAVLTVLSYVVEREIVNRVLQCNEGDPDSGLLAMFQELLGNNDAPVQATASNRFNRRSARPNRPVRSPKGSSLLRSHQ